MSLFENRGNGKFEDVTKKAGLDSGLHGTRCTAGDYDNDGFVDLAVSSGDRVLLLHNEKNGTFKETTEASGLKPAALLHGVTWVDYDHDGDIDLLLNSFMLTRSGDHKAHEVWRTNAHGPITTATDATRFDRPHP